MGDRCDEKGGVQTTTPWIPISLCPKCCTTDIRCNYVEGLQCMNWMICPDVYRLEGLGAITGTPEMPTPKPKPGPKPTPAPKGIAEVCELPLMPGSCFAAFPRVYFDSSDGQCKDFTYGGCAGNANNFRNKEECEELCGGIFDTMLHVLLNDKLLYTKCRSIHINLFY